MLTSASGEIGDPSESVFPDQLPPVTASGRPPDISGPMSGQTISAKPATRKMKINVKRRKNLSFNKGKMRSPANMPANYGGIAMATSNARDTGI